MGRIPAMIKLCALLILGTALFFSLPGRVLAQPTTYYVSPNGSDANNGTSPSTPWQTINKIDSATFQAGDRILFEGGQTFPGSLYFDSSDNSTAQSPITISSYGTGRATINGNNGDAIYIYNLAGFDINNINLVGSGESTNSGSGINIYTDLAGDVKLDHIYIDQVETSGFGKYGIVIGGWNNLSGYKNVNITNVSSHGNKLAGIATYGQAYPANQDVYVGHSVAYQNVGDPQVTTANGDPGAGSGIILGSVDNGTVEYSSAYDNDALCKANECGVGIWTYDSNNVTIQHNESYDNKTNGSADGDGFDLDQNVSNSYLQYNYSHDNDGAGLLLAQSPNTTSHTNNTVRYNISQNDARHNTSSAGIVVWGSVQDANIYNNTVYMSPISSGTPSGMTIANWNIESQGVSGIYVRNNIFQTTVNVPLVTITAPELSTGTNIKFQQNDYFSTGTNFKVRWGSTTYTSLAGWRTATGQEMNGTASTGLDANPKLNNPGNGGTVGDPTKLSSLSAYHLQATSPLINKGFDLSQSGLNPGTTDFYGSSLPSAGLYDLGAYEFPVAFSLSGSATPSTAAAGSTINLSATFTANASLSALSDVEVYGSQGRVYQFTKNNDIYTANTPKTYSKSWNTTGLPAGTYTLYMGVWTPNWGQEISWQPIGTITLQ